MIDEEERARRFRDDRQLAELQFEKGVSEGQCRAIIRQAFENRELVEALRQRAWVRRYPSQCRLEGNDQVIVPEGWPLGTDEGAEVMAALQGD